MKIGVLALQGDFAEHQVMLEGLGVELVQVRLAQHLEGLSGLIIPGGEFTTIGKLAEDFQMISLCASLAINTPSGAPVPERFSYLKIPTASSLCCS